MKLGKFLKYYTSVLQNEELRKIPHLLIGDVGIGKTQGIKWAAAKVGYKVVSFILSRHRPEHLEGLPTIPKNHDTKFYEKLLPELLGRLLENNGRVVLFLDELNTANELMFNAALSIIYDRELGGVKLPDSIAVIAAGNPIGEQIAYVRQIPTTIANGMIVLSVEPDFNFLLESGIANQLFVPEIISYLSFNPKAFNDEEFYYLYDKTAPVRAKPRTWELLSRELRTGTIKLTREYIELISGYIGPVHAEKLMNFTKFKDTLEAFVHGKLDNRSLDDMTKIALLANIATNSKLVTEDNAYRLLELISTLSDEYKMTAYYILKSSDEFIKQLSNLYKKKDKLAITIMLELSNLRNQSLNIELFPSEETNNENR